MTKAPGPQPKPRRKYPERLEILGHSIDLGQVADLAIPFSESYLGNSVSIPVRVIRARKPGPAVFLFGAIHGDELNGVGIIREILYDKPPLLLRGTLICVPVVNVYGLENHSRYLPDRRDVNRCFPGSAKGSMSRRLAHAVFHEIVKKCDYGIDFHSAAALRMNYPNVRADFTKPKVRWLARAFGSEMIVNGKGPKGSLRHTAVAEGIPTIILEAGEIGKIEPGVVEIGVSGVMNVLRYLEMVDGSPKMPLFQASVQETTWVRAARGGFLSFHVRPGDLVRENQYIATNCSIFGRERDLIASPAQGIVLGMTTMPAVKPGTPVCHIAKLPGRTLRYIEKKIEQSSDRNVFRRIQHDLASNINYQARSD